MLRTWNSFSGNSDTIDKVVYLVPLDTKRRAVTLLNTDEPRIMIKYSYVLFNKLTNTMETTQVIIHNSVVWSSETRFC